MVLFIAHINKSKSIGGDSPRIIKPTVCGTLGAKRSQKTTGRIENLNSVVVTIRYDVLPDPVHRYPGQAIEFTLAAAVRSELLHEVPITVEHLCQFRYNFKMRLSFARRYSFKIYINLNYLNTMVRAVGHYDGVVRANREASGPSKASGFAPPHPELEQLPPLQQVVTPPPIAVYISNNPYLMVIVKISYIYIYFLNTTKFKLT